MRLISAGAAQTVTGSCHLLEVRDRRILVDCGLFQGRESDLNRAPFPFDPAAIDAVLLTHGHLDHCGRLPQLVKSGFSGPIHALRATREITDIILHDSAKIQVEDWERAQRRARKKGGDPDAVPEPLYRPGDVAQTMSAFRDVGFDAPIDLGEGLRVIYRPAGHILGSAFLVLESPEVRVVCSGDLGNRESGVQRDFASPPECDAVLVETTYADRAHRSLKETLAEFRSVIRSAVESDSIVMIPSFALERTQNVLYWLGRMMEEDEIEPVDVYLDSPMATKMTRLYQECANQFEPAIQEALDRGDDPFEPDTLVYTISTEESRRINDLDCCAIVIAGSGMMTGGRILHHLLHHLWKEDAHLVVVGYQAEGTLGRRLVDGAKSVRIMGKDVGVNAQVSTIGGFSAHADRDDLLAWLGATGDATAYLVHGETDVMDAFSAVLAERGRRSVQVVRNETYDLA